MVAARKSPPVQLQPFLTLLHLAEKRQRERRRSRDTRPGSTTPPIPEEPEDVPSDSGYMSGDSLSPPERQQHPAASIHRKHAPPSRSDTRTSTGFREPPVSWHHDGPAIAVGGAQYPGAFPDHTRFPDHIRLIAVRLATHTLQCGKCCAACVLWNASLLPGLLDGCVATLVYKPVRSTCACGHAVSTLSCNVCSG